MEQGYIKIYRKIFENEIVNKTPEHLVIWIYLLTNATYTERETYFNGEKIIIKKGQIITGRKKIAEETHVNESKVQRVLEQFYKNQIIEQQKTNKNRLITINNWDKYQCCEQQMNNKRTTNEQQMNTYNKDNKDNKVNKEYKEEKNKKEENEIQHKYLENPELNTLFIEFLEIRKKLKAVNTPRAIEMLINKLQEYPEAEAKEMIKQSMVNSWKGLFPLKKKNEEKRNYLEELYDEGNQ